MTRPHTPETFWAKVDQRGDDDCWPWLGGIASNGYGRVVYDRRSQPAHRIAYLLTHDLDAIPHDLELMHTCDEPACCNPNHLKLGTHTDNMADAAAKRRMPHGRQVRRARLTESQVRDIRQRYSAGGVSYRQLGREYGVPNTTIFYVVQRMTWKHVE